MKKEIPGPELQLRGATITRELMVPRNLVVEQLFLIAEAELKSFKPPNNCKLAHLLGPTRPQKVRERLSKQRLWPTLH